MAIKRILIIEDDIHLADSLSELLEDEGYFVECAKDAVKGEILIRKGNFDVILLDYKMPLLSGIDILKKLKADNIRKRIFIVSGRPSTERSLKEEDVFDMISGIIVKPINIEAFLEKIKNA
ncbi:MAG: response regulator [Candidatus Omnitrophica bacterium]|nr:response regulator [Candidatus Omnitrophota bacterium]